MHTGGTLRVLYTTEVGTNGMTTSQLTSDLHR